MKNLLFLLLPAFLFACGGVEKHRASIESLDTNWDSTTTAVTEFSNTMNSDLATFSRTAADMRFSEEALKKLKPEQVTAWQNAQSAFAQSLQAFAPIRTQVAEFNKSWQAKATEVQALKDNLAAGTLEGDVATQVADLNALVAKANESLASWKTAHAAAKSRAQAAADALKAQYDTLSAQVG